MNRSNGLVKSKPLWSSNGTGRSVLGWRIPEPIFAVFFILVVLALAKDENVVSKVRENKSVQIALAILVLYCIYNRAPWSLMFIIGFIASVCFTDILTDAKGTVEKIWGGVSSQIRKDHQSQDPALMRMGARVLGIMNNNKVPPKSILKRSNEKKVSFDDVESEGDESESDSDDEMCSKVSQAFGFSDVESDTEAETTDNETEEDQERRKDDLLSFMNTVSATGRKQKPQ